MDIISSDVNITRWVIVSVGMIFMLGSLALLANKVGPIGSGTLKRSRGKKRIKLVDTLHLDGRNRVSILQVDDIEHVVLLGQHGELHLHSQDAPEVKAEEAAMEEEPSSIGFLKEMKTDKKEDNEKGKKK